MYKTVTISFIGFFTLLLLQTYWLSNLYDIHKMQCEKIIEEQLKISINKEVTIRREWGNIQNPQNPKIIIKSAQSMTQEEMHRKSTAKNRNYQTLTPFLTNFNLSIYR